MYEIAKLILEHADSICERQQAVKTALYLGMPLHEIEEYLDWLDAVRGHPLPERKPEADASEADLRADRD